LLVERLLHAPARVTAELHPEVRAPKQLYRHGSLLTDIDASKVLGVASASPVDARTERIGRNEDLFRKVNDQIEGVNEAFGTITGTMSILCECGQLACIEQIGLTVDEYRELR